MRYFASCHALRASLMSIKKPYIIQMAISEDLARSTLLIGHDFLPEIGQGFDNFCIEKNQWSWCWICNFVYFIEFAEFHPLFIINIRTAIPGVIRLAFEESLETLIHIRLLFLEWPRTLTVGQESIIKKTQKWQTNRGFLVVS